MSETFILLFFDKTVESLRLQKNHSLGKHEEQALSVHWTLRNKFLRFLKINIVTQVNSTKENQCNPRIKLLLILNETKEQTDGHMLT